MCQTDGFLMAVEMHGLRQINYAPYDVGGEYCRNM